MASSTTLPPHLFQTNDPPTESERVYIQHQIQLAQFAREAVFKTIKPKFLSPRPDKEYLEDLAELLSLEAFIYKHQCLLSPLRYLPPELLTEIFLFAIPRERFFETEPDVAIEEPNHRFILRLSQVCRYWRKVALAEQRLWTSIPALGKWQSDQPEPESKIQLMRTFIERSGNAPIHVTILILQVFNNLILEGGRLESPCLDLLAAQCHRWKTAILHVDLSIVERLGQLDAPILESLNFKCRYPGAWMFVSGPYPRLRVLAPRLRQVIADSWQSHSFLQLPWNEISIFKGLPDDLESMRPAGPNLKACTFRGPISRIEYPTEPILFDKLNFLFIDNSNYQPPHFQFGQEFETPFRWMAVPNLEFLFMKGHPVLPGASLIVRDLLLTTLPSSSVLLILHFHVRGLTEDDFRRLLSATPLLKRLSICDTPSHYFSHLIRGDPITPNVPQQPLLPKLECLVIRNFSGNDAGPLVALAESRRSKRQQFLSISLFYSSIRQCLNAQERVEGWDEILKREGAPGSELAKVRSWANYVAKHVLGPCGKARDYGFTRRPKYISQSLLEMDAVLKLIEQHEFNDLRILEVS
ncbi:hypothetical protein M413DRAFT_32564 [Hebeloma cylindrosporum]|uniref:F-box domain-containing protein n=1 Tax=Hebeloma cylindrosporum TaxID=76867 RepID=A0A0C3BEV8_HEBCY|nr:hypothetical protein M413DRAFT_32564 [Hebeloma cylindrosporum h7]